MQERKKTSWLTLGAAGIAAAVGAKYLVKASVFVVAAVAGRSVVSKAAEHFRSTPEGRQMLAGISSAGLSTDSILRVYGDSSFIWFRDRSARAVATSLSVDEQAEVLNIRLALTRALSPDDCAQSFWDGAAPATAKRADELTSVLPVERRERLAFLAGRALGFSFQDRVTSVAPMTDDEWVLLVDSIATDEEITTIVAATQPDASASARCSGVQALYSLLLRTPTSSSARPRAFKYVLSSGAG